MARNIVRDYIDYDRKKMIKYIDIITEKKLYSKITDMIVDTYVNVRYFDMYEHVKNNIIDDISYYVKEKLETEFESKNTKRNNILVNDVFPLPAEPHNIICCVNPLDKSSLILGTIIAWSNDCGLNISVNNFCVTCWFSI